MNPIPLDPQSTPVIPDHELLRKIGSGNYGDVWLARNVIGAFRAVKMVYRATFSDARPFEREFNGIKKYEPISRSHPGLVQVLQVGRNEDAGYFYYVMELADDCLGGQEFHPETYSARTLNRDLMTRGRFDFNDVIEFGSSVAAALGHLHENGLIHRDIKPSNIIFVAGQPKLADIGLVVSVGESGTMVGTEGFIPPEGPTSPQADIYSFGKVLYEIATGNDRNCFPEVPETVGDLVDTEQFSELNEVINKACAPAAASRYQTAEALRNDLEVLRVGKSVRRLRVLERRVSVFTRLGIAAGIVIALAVAGIFAVNVARQRQQHLRALAYIEGGSRMVEERNLHAALPYFAQALELQQADKSAADLQRLRIGMLLRESPQLLRVWTNKYPAGNLHFMAKGKHLLISQEHTAEIWDLASKQSLAQFRIPVFIETAVPSPDETRLLISAGKLVYLFDILSKREEHVWTLPYGVRSAILSADGKRLAVSCVRGHAFVFDAEEASNDPLFELKGHTKDIDDIAFSPDGERLATACRDDSARLWDAHTGAQMGSPMLHESWVYQAKFSADGSRIITTSADRTVRVWDVETHQPALRAMDHRDGVHRAVFSPDMTKIASGGSDETIVLWDAYTGRPLGTKLNHDKPVIDVAFDASGRLLATGDYGGTVKIWDLEPVPVVDIGNSYFSEDSKLRAVLDGTFSLFENGVERPLADHVPLGRKVNRVLFAPADNRVVLLSTNAEAETLLSVCDRRDGFKPRPWFSIGPMTAIVLSGDGTHAFAAGRGKKSFRIWDLDNGRVIYGPASIPEDSAGMFSPDGKMFAYFGSRDLQFFDIATKQKVGVPFHHSRPTWLARFSRDGSRLLTGTQDTELSACAARLWDVKSGRLITGPLEHDDGVLDVRFNDDETLLATGSEDNYARVWSATTGELLMQSARHNDQVSMARFGLGGAAILTAANDTLRLLESLSGYPLIAPLVFPRERIVDAGFIATNVIWVRLPERAVRVELVRARQSDDELKELIGALGTSQIMRGRGAWTATDASQWRNAVDHIVEPARLSECLADIPRWHEQQALDCERQRRWEAARFHYSQLTALSPTNTNYSAKLTAMIERLSPPATSP